MDNQPTVRPVRIRLVLPALILGLCLVAGTAVVAQTFYKVKALNNSLSVTGSVDKLIKSDSVKWHGHFFRNAAVDGLTAGSQLIKKDLADITDFLKANGITEAQITISPLTVTPTCGGNQNYYSDGKTCGPNPIIGYNLDQSVTVESGDVDGVTKAAQAATNVLLEKGVIFSSDPLEYYYTKLADLRLDMLAEATKNAKDRAERIVGSTGGQLGPVLSASMGVFQVSAVNSMEVSDYGNYDTTTIQKKVTAVVRVSFGLP